MQDTLIEIMHDLDTAYHNTSSWRCSRRRQILDARNTIYQVLLECDECNPEWKNDMLIRAAIILEPSCVGSISRDFDSIERRILALIDRGTRAKSGHSMLK